MYRALYRKWRPSVFDDVIGQEHITTTLKNQVSMGKPSHAYLFCGSRGTGKTSCSKILAKAVNCPNQSDGNPCNNCNICKGIDNDSILDITEIDAASNSGVDNIRELREEANFTPVSTKYRVYIIDETHMLSTGAFNALLKIMEEPPPHVIFILATTEIHKVPATILSRCQRFDFMRIPSSVISAHLLHIAKEENAVLDNDAAMLIAKLSDGGMRDALSLLDLCLALDNNVTYSLVQQSSGLTDESYLFDIAYSVTAEDFKEVLELLTNLWTKSIDPIRLCYQLLDFYRDLMVVKSTKDSNELIENSPEYIENLKKLSIDYSLARILYSLTTLSDTLARINKTSMRRSELEMGLLKLCDTSLSSTSEGLVARIEKLERSLKHGIPASNTSINKESDTEKTLASEIVDPKDTEKEEPQIEIDNINLTETTPFDKWPEVLEVLLDKNKALYGSLVNSKAYTVGDLLLVDSGSELFNNMVREDEYARDSLRDCALLVTGIRYRLGPYQEDKYAVTKEDNNTLKDMLESAKDLGLNIDITE